MRVSLPPQCPVPAIYQPPNTTHRFLLQAIGLQHSAIPPPNYAAGFLVTNFLFAHMASNTRWPKMYYGLDHNACPRQDLDKYADAMVQEGKLSAEALEALRRQEAAHQNNVENFPFFCGTMLFALYAGLSNRVINRVGALYTVIRIGYTVAYTVTDTENASWIRSGLWFAGNGLCIWTLIKCGQEINCPAVMPDWLEETLAN